MIDIAEFMNEGRVMFMNWEGIAFEGFRNITNFNVGDSE